MSLILKIFRAFTQFSIAFSLMRLAIILFSTNPLINLALAILSIIIFINTLGLVGGRLGLFGGGLRSLRGGLGSLRDLLGLVRRPRNVVGGLRRLVGRNYRFICVLKGGICFTLNPFSRQLCGVCGVNGALCGCIYFVNGSDNSFSSGLQALVGLILLLGFESLNFPVDLVNGSYHGFGRSLQILISRVLLIGLESLYFSIKPVDSPYYGLVRGIQAAKSS